MKLEELISTVYAEKDFSRSIATAIAAIAGLITYLWKRDWAISALTALIVFPATRIIADSIHANWISRISKKSEISKVREQFDRLSPDEKQIVRSFVESGGACVSWSFVNSSRRPFPRPALNSLISRGIVSTSVMEDGMSESFVLDIDVFDYAQRYLPSEF